MKNSFKYIFSLFIALSLFGIGGNLSLTINNVKYIKETEWVIKVSSSRKPSKCFIYNTCFYATTTNSNLKTWSNEQCINYSQEVNVLFLVQTKMSNIVCPKNFSFNKFHILRQSTEDHLTSINMTDLSSISYLSNGIRLELGNNTWNSILSREWTNRLIKSLVFSKHLYALLIGLDVSYTLFSQHAL